MNSVEDIGFSCAVFSHKTIHSGIQLKVCLTVIFKIDEGK
jgi:hypothetical protein